METATTFTKGADVFDYATFGETLYPTVKAETAEFLGREKVGQIVRDLFALKHMSAGRAVVEAARESGVAIEDLVVEVARLLKPHVGRVDVYENDLRLGVEAAAA